MTLYLFKVDPNSAQKLAKDWHETKYDILELFESHFHLY